MFPSVNCQKHFISCLSEKEDGIVNNDFFSPFFLSLTKREKTKTSPNLPLASYTSFAQEQGAALARWGQPS